MARALGGSGQRAPAASRARRRIDHQSYWEQGIELEPTSHLGRAVDEMRARGEQPERFRQLDEVCERNALKIEQRPEIVSTI